MSLTAGSRIGPYEISAQIGVGGMGEVYRATDTHLARQVAIKVLPDAFAADPERLARFDREARTLAALNHPNIAQIHGLEKSASTIAIVMELVEGPTLADRIAGRAIPVKEAIGIARQIAEALEAAHELGIVHRDLKPANIKLREDGTVKVLDFGLAKTMEPTTALSPELSQSPTITTFARTRPGIILGTAAYIAPEQVRGKPVDRRTDIWAFGVVFFEMLTARRLFSGETVTETLAKVLEREPDWQRLPQRTPSAVRNLLKRCLTKNPRDRLQAIGDARTLLQELDADTNAPDVDTEPVAHPLWKKLLPWALAPVFLAAGWLLKPLAVPSAPAEVRWELGLPDGQVLSHRFRHGAEISPDGKRIAFVANAAARQAAESRIYLKHLDQWESVAIPGTEGALNPFFSPDGQWLGFVQGTQIKKVALAGGTPMVLTELAVQSFGATWGPDAIVFADARDGGLKVIRDEGGQAEAFTNLDTASHEVSHRLPHFLPDGSGVLFTVIRYSSTAPDWTRSQVWIQSLHTRQRTLLLENALDARYVANGSLVFARQGRLFAVRFDPGTLSVSGSPVPVLDGVTHAMYGGASDVTTGAAQFSVSDNGVLVYAPGSIEPPGLNLLVWVNRSGTVTPVGLEPVTGNAQRVAQDGKRIIFADYYVTKDVWVAETTRAAPERQTTEGQNINPVLSPDGSRFAFRSDRAGPQSIYVKRLDSPDVAALTDGLVDDPSSWTPDGKELAFVRVNPDVTGDIYVVAVDQPTKARAIVNTRFHETHPEFSPDGQWLAYCSTVSGARELYVQPYPGPGRPVRVSTDGASEPAWSRDGKELFYRNGRSMMVVHFAVSGTEFVPQKPVPLFEGQFVGGGFTRGYDVAPDGRFLMRQTVPQSGDLNAVFPPTLRVVLNWHDAVKRLASSN